MKLMKKLNEIITYIKEANFRLAASKYSIANSSNKGGEIGWIKETLLSPILIKKLKNLKKVNSLDQLNIQMDT